MTRVSLCVAVLAVIAQAHEHGHASPDHEGRRLSIRDWLSKATGTGRGAAKVPKVQHQVKAAAAASGCPADPPPSHWNRTSCESLSFMDRVRALRRGARKRVLVTGGAGFIGSHVAEFTSRGLNWETIAADDLSGGFTRNVPPGCTFVNVDLKDPEAVAQLFRVHGPFDYVYHLAAYAAEGLSHFIRRYNYRNNLEASVSLINQAVLSKTKAFIFTSSSATARPDPARSCQPEPAALLSPTNMTLRMRSNHHPSPPLQRTRSGGVSPSRRLASRPLLLTTCCAVAAFGVPDTLPIVEETLPHPEDPYGISKFAVELDLKAAKHMFGMDFIVFRPHNVYGPRQNTADKFRNAIGIFMNQIMSGEPMTIFGDGSQTRGFSYIDDVAPLIALSPATPGARNEAFFVGSDQEYSVLHLSHAVSRAMGKPHNVQHLAQRKEVAYAYACHAKLRCFFNPAPVTSLHKGLARTVEYARTLGKLTPTGFEDIEVWDRMPPSWVTALEQWSKSKVKTAAQKPKGEVNYWKVGSKEAPRVNLFAINWPQWHSTPLNDYWYHKGYTDWDLLCSAIKLDGAKSTMGWPMLRPLPPPRGLGWYNHTDKVTRKRQALLAKEYGIYGFAYYHYWFGRNSSWGRAASWRPQDEFGADMDESVMKLLDESDGEPNMPFYFVWANEAFVWKWKRYNSGRVGKLPQGGEQVPMNYRQDSWRPHWEYLLRFFKHPNYHKIDGMPVLANFQTSPAPPDEMWASFRRWAVEAGFPGIYLLQWFHGKAAHKQGGQWAKQGFAPWADAVQNFGWTSGMCNKRVVPNVGSETGSGSNWHHGIVVDFDNTARRGDEASVAGVNKRERMCRGGPKSYEKGLHLLMKDSVAIAKRSGFKDRMILIDAFNEWTEQAVMEPSDIYGLGYLEATRKVMMDHGQYFYTGEHGLWKTVEGAEDVPQLTDCAPSLAPRREE